MSERILSLLSLCLEARELNEYVFFDYNPAVDSVHIYCYKDYNELLMSQIGEAVPRKIDHYFYLTENMNDVEAEIAKAETAVKELIKNAMSR
jgi:hypothetical protein